MLRANAGECVQVTLINELPLSPPKTDHWVYNPPLFDGFNVNQVRSSNHISLQAQMVWGDANRDIGVNVGRNDMPDGSSEFVADLQLVRG